MKLMVAVIGCFFSVLLAGPAQAAAFPERPVTLIVPFPPGGGTDVHLRKLAHEAGKYLGQQIIIENKPGASGSVALAALVSNAPDGYKLSVLVPTSLRLPLLQKMSYDPLNDFTYISMLSGYTYVIAVRADSPFKTWRELVDFAKAHPGKLNYGNAGINSTTHLVMEQIAALEGVKWNAIPYKGDGDQIQDLLGGQLDMGTPSMGVSPHVESGRVRLLAVWSKGRTERFPNVPNLVQQGTNIVPEIPYGLVGPAGMKPEVVKVLAEAFRKASAEEANKETLRQLGQLDMYLGPAEYLAWAKVNFERERELIQNASKKGGK
jgi:tripartite-type tricarboxylate transporter receptor subunit TctC